MGAAQLLKPGSQAELGRDGKQHLLWVRTVRSRDQAPECSPGLGARVLVAAPADRLGPLPGVTQVLVHHVVVLSAPAAILGELDTCEGWAAVWRAKSGGNSPLPDAFVPRPAQDTFCLPQSGLSLAPWCSIGGK